MKLQPLLDKLLPFAIPILCSLQGNLAANRNSTSKKQQQLPKKTSTINE